jgi:hypothetical protein
MKVKKIVLAVSVMALVIGSLSFADGAATGGAPQKSYVREYGMAGCGLGAVIVGRKGGQIFAGTTNYTVYNQMFGITFGTLNCEDGPNNTVAQNMDSFVAANKVALASDMARGGGETLANLSSMMGCDASADVGSEMQKNFRSIFPDADQQPNVITDSIITVVRSGPLATSCKKIS